MFELVKKDFLLMLPKRKKKGRAANVLFTLFFVALFIAVVIFLFASVLNKVSSFARASETFFAAFLLLALIVSIISGLMRAEKLFFNTSDIRQVGTMPISSSKFVASKLVVFLTLEFITNFFLTYPLFITYAILQKMPGWFYFLSLAYPFCALILEIGFVLLFIIPAHVFIKFLKKHNIFMTISVITCTVVAAFVYYVVLSMFIEFVTERGDALFTSHNIDVLNSIFSKVVPLIWLVRAFIVGDWTYWLLFSASALLLLSVGLLECLGAYSPSMRYQPMVSNRVQKLVYRKTSVATALIKKEFGLLTYSSLLFSFASLLTVQPFLLYLVTSALNRIFKYGVFFYYTAYVPELVPITDILIVLLFTTTINQSANNYVSMENNMVVQIKTFPISHKIQMAVKLTIPYVLSLISLIVSCTVLCATGTMSVVVSLCTVVLSAVLLAAFELSSLACELDGKRAQLYFYLYLLPVLFWVVSIVLCFVGLPIVLVSVIGVLLFVLCALPYIVRFVKNPTNSDPLGGEL